MVRSSYVGRVFNMSTDLFWQDFVRDHWERKPVCFTGPALITPDEAFHAAVLSSQRFLRMYREHPESEELRPDVRFYRGGAMVTTDLADLLPNARDVSAELYVRRIEEQLAGGDFELVVNQLQSDSGDLWFRLRDFARPLYAEAGFPAGGADAVLFLRNHPATSFGVHKDRASVFAFLLSGRKRILTWEEHGYRGEPFSSRYSAFLTNAHVLDGNAGDVLYWPSSHWHVGEAEPGFSMSVNVGFRYRMASNWSERKRIASLVEQCASLEDVQRLCCSGDLDYEMQIWRLTRQTGYGFRAPALRTGTFAASARLRGSPDHPIMRLLMPGRPTIVAANGRAFAMDADSDLDSLLELLNSGQSFLASDMISQSSGSTGELLRKLYGCWAITDDASQPLNKGAQNASR
jgi:hypothetical protein